MQNAFRTDLAAEAFERLSAGRTELRGAASRQEELFGLPLFAVSITGEEAAEKIGKPLGQYYTLSLASPLTRAAPDFGAAAAAVAPDPGLVHKPDIRPQQGKGIGIRRQNLLDFRGKRTADILPKGQVYSDIRHGLIISVSDSSIAENLSRNKRGRRAD